MAKKYGGAELGLDVDMAISGPTPVGAVENILGFVSLGSTVAADVLEGNTWPGQEVTIGRDTIVSARNTGLGIIPEANVDFIINISQLDYDIKRQNGELPGGAIVITDWKQILTQTVWDNTPWQSAWQSATDWLSNHGLR